MERKINNKYIHFTEEINSLDFLQKSYEYIKQVELHPNDWKWVIISLHGSLYGFAVCALRGTNLERVTYNNSKGVRRLESFDEIMRRCQIKKSMDWTVMSKELILTDEHKDSIERLSKQFRNNFEHFMPCSWSIEIHGFPKIAIDVLDVIRFLALDTGNYVRINKSQRRKVKSLVFQSKRVLKSSKLYQESVNREKQYNIQQKIIQKKNKPT